jgi:amino acid adenylation domain-containing protein
MVKISPKSKAIGNFKEIQMENMNMSESKERTLAAGQNIKERDYWLEKLSGRLVKTTFPCDSKKADEKDMVSVTFKFVDPVYSNLLRISNKSDVRLHIILVAGWLMLLHRYTGADDIIVGIPTYRQDVEGQLINTALALGNTVTGEMTVKELLLQVGQTVLKANENQNYPIETLIYKLNVPESDGDFPLFDISVLLEELHDKSYLDHIPQNLVVSFRKSTASLEGVMEYNANLYSEATMQRIVRHFCQLVEHALTDVNVPISQLEILSQQERNQLLKDFNDNTADFSRDKSIYRFVEDQALRTPGAAAVSFEGRSRTYEQLNRSANRLVRALMANGIRTDHTVGILMDRNPTMVESILAVWKAGGAYIPLDMDYPWQRLLGILNDSDTGVLFADTHALDPQLYKKLKESYSGIIVDITTNDPSPGNLEEGRGEPGYENPDLDIPMYSLAYVIYTSGSTGKPKGAMVEHIGMMNHIQSKIDLLGITEKSVVAQNASHTFDISVWQFFVALTQGGKTVIYPDALILDPVKFIHRLNEDRVCILEVVPSYLAVMLDAEAAQDAVSLTVPLEYLLVTGEEIKPHLAARWFEMYPGIPMVNAYGPTEASDDITHHVMDCAPRVERIPIGKPVRNLNIYIVDQYMKLCPIGAAGEIWVSGVGVGRGYLKDEERTALAFMDDPFADEPGVRLYKTGDLGRWLADGTIEFLGRMDYQVKIRGFRIELGEIENCLVRHSLVKEAVVTDREDAEGNKYLCAYIVGSDAFKKDSDIEALKGYLSQILPDYMVPAHFVVLEQFPLTPNGKIDRKALPAPEIHVSDIPYISEEALKQWQVEYEARGFQGPAAVDQAGKKPRRRIDPAEEVPELYKKLEQYPKPPGKTYYPLSHSQKMLYFNEKILPGKAFNNLFFTVKYPGTADPGLLQQAINTALLKNPGLRLRIVELDLGSSIEPAQYVAEHKDCQLESVDFSSRDNDKDPVQGLEKWLWEKIEEPFQLIDSDLFYFAYIKYNSQESGYCVKLHHTACDGWTFYRLFAEIHHIYRQLKKDESPDETPNPSYIQHLLEERDYLTSPQFEKDRVFWQKNMLPLPQAADISLKEGSVFDVEIRVSRKMVPGELCRRMKEYCKKHGTSIYRLFLSALSIYVYRAAGVEDFVIGSVKHSRSSPAKRQMAGMMIDFFPFRVKIDTGMEFGDFVEKNGQDFRYMIKNHGQYPFYILLTELKEITGVDSAYLNNVSIVEHPTPEGEYSFQHHSNHYSFDPLTLHIFYPDEREKEWEIELKWEYQAARFCHTHIASIHRSLLSILADALENPEKPISQIDILSEEDKRLILHTFNNTFAEFPADKTLYQLFEEQVTRTPTNTAVRVEDFPGSLTYEELNQKANQLARHLRSRGVTTNSIAAMLVKRSFEMIIGILAVMKAGGAYLPIGLTDPENRIAYMCRDCGTELILTDKTRELPEKAAISMMLDVTDESLYQGEDINLPLVNTSLDPAAIFYTSGSTGKPKGVIVEHRGLVNRLWWLNRLFQTEETDVFLQQTPVTFDVSVWELLGWSFRGASVYFLAPYRGDKFEHIVEAAIKGRVTYMHITPAFQLTALDYIETRDKLRDMGRLKQVIASGEALLPVHVNAFNRLLYRSSGTRLFNLYGPTEASIEVSYFDCSSDENVEKVPIGKPIDNIHLYIVADDLNLVPMGVPGHLCIAGAAVARGYVNQPLLTREAFRQDPYVPGDRMYFTGDLARWLPDGNIDFLGRIDRQVQLDGFRIEPGEIESLLLKHNDVKEAAVVPWGEEKNRRLTLCAFLVAQRDLSQSDLKMVLVSELPRLMIPSRFIELDRMPVNSSGKIDRKTLEQMVPFCQPEEKNITAEIMNRMKTGDKTPLMGTLPAGKEMDVDDRYEISGEDEYEYQYQGEHRQVILTEEEKKRILYEFNDTEADYPRDKTLSLLFEDQAARTPGHTAVSSAARSAERGEQSQATYRELNEQANRIAHFLKNQGVTAGAIVGVMMERSIKMIAALIAVMKAGGVYLPIGLEFPRARITYMLEDCRAEILLTDNLAHKEEPPFKTGGISPGIVHIDEARQGDDTASNPPGLNDLTDPVHILYTSGTTGNPKGVIIEHKNVVRLLFNNRNPFDFSSSDVWTMFHEYFFDFSVWEMYGALLYGGKLVVISAVAARDIACFRQIVINQQVTVLNQTPTNFYYFADEELKHPGKELRIRYVIFGGESLKPIKLKKWKEKYPETRLINMYGITETTVHVTFKEIGDKEIDSNQNNIGRPIPTLKTFILNQQQEPVPVGVIGEIFVAGEGLSKGYVNQPELTAEKFDQDEEKKKKAIDKNLLTSLPLYPSTSLYRTGDLARWLPDGEIEFLGRKDHQIQLGGLRIEPGEIENVLLTYDGVEEAAVVVRRIETGEKQLRAVLAASQEITGDQLRKHLVRELPHYLVPSEFLRLEKMPVTSTGKIDRKILSFINIDAEDRSRQVEYVAPKTELETQIADIWKEVLNANKVGIHDNFFDLGGNSLGIIQVNFKLKAVFKREIPALIMFEYSTIASMVRYLEQTLGLGPAPEASSVEDQPHDRVKVKTRGRNRMQQRRTKIKKDREQEK